MGRGWRNSQERGRNKLEFHKIGTVASVMCITLLWVCPVLITVNGPIVRLSLRCHLMGVKKGSLEGNQRADRSMLIFSNDAWVFFCLGWPEILLSGSDTAQHERHRTKKQGVVLFEWGKTELRV